MDQTPKYSIVYSIIVNWQRQTQKDQTEHWLMHVHYIDQSLDSLIVLW